MRASVILFCLAAPGLALAAAAPPKDVEALQVVIASPDARALHRTIPYSQLEAEKNIRLPSPHTSQNPKRKLETWGGVVLRDLLARQGLTLAFGAPITLVGGDSYSVQLWSQDIARHDILVAVERHGRRIAWYEGGPQIVYPTSDPKLPEVYLADSWWTWYLSAVIVGNPAPFLKVKGAQGGKVILDLRKNPGAKGTLRERSYPPGQRRLSVPRTKAWISSVPLPVVLGPSSSVKSNGWRLKTYLGGSEPLRGDPAQYELRFAWDGATIPAAFGGPVQLCRIGGGNDCVYFVRTIEADAGR